jgi:hypothetical protein
MPQTAHIHGPVSYRAGDGANVFIRPGPIEVETTAIDATLSWVDGDTHGSTAMPMASYLDYVEQGAIRLHA